MRKRNLILEDGTVFEGYGFGSEEVSKGEIVFNTGMTGYRGSYHRSKLLRTICNDDVPSHWKLWNQSRRL